MDAKQLLEEALRLPDEERTALAGELIQSLETEGDADPEGISSRFEPFSIGSMLAGPQRFHGWRHVVGFTRQPAAARALEYLLDEALKEVEAADVRRRLAYWRRR